MATIDSSPHLLLDQSPERNLTSVTAEGFLLTRYHALKESLIDLYLDVKVRSNEEVRFPLRTEKV